MNTMTDAAEMPTLRGRAGTTTIAAETQHAHGICWGAVFAGALGAAALSLLLLMLGVGLGLSSVSPWAGEGASAQTFGVSTIVWITFTQLAASAMGGYLAGRLRARWLATHADEVHFRDTAHGFLAWSLATLVTAGMLASAVGTVVSGGAKAGAVVAGTATAATATAATTTADASSASASAISPAYLVDGLWRKDASAAASAATTSTDTSAPPTAEAIRIFANAARTGAMPPDDASYLAQLVSQRTGLAPADAQKRVTDGFTRLQAAIADAKEQAKAAADQARKASAMASLWFFISLLIGAFVASFMATLGGRQRDRV